MKLSHRFFLFSVQLFMVSCPLHDFPGGSTSGGSISIAGGLAQGLSANDQGGDLKLSGGGTPARGVGGSVDITSGSGPESSSGDVDLRTAHAGSSASSDDIPLSGSISIATGSAVDAASGAFVMSTGSSSGSSAGTIALAVGASGSGQGSPLLLSAGNSVDQINPASIGGGVGIESGAGAAGSGAVAISSAQPSNFGVPENEPLLGAPFASWRTEESAPAPPPSSDVPVSGALSSCTSR